MSISPLTASASASASEAYQASAKKQKLADGRANGVTGGLANEDLASQVGTASLLGNGCGAKHARPQPVADRSVTVLASASASASSSSPPEDGSPKDSYPVKKLSDSIADIRKIIQGFQGKREEVLKSYGKDPKQLPKEYEELRKIQQQIEVVKQNCKKAIDDPAYHQEIANREVRVKQELAILNKQIEELRVLEEGRFNQEKYTIHLEANQAGIDFLQGKVSSLKPEHVTTCVQDLQKYFKAKDAHVKQLRSEIEKLADSIDKSNEALKNLELEVKQISSQIALTAGPHFIDYATLALLKVRIGNPKTDPTEKRKCEQDYQRNLKLLGNKNQGSISVLEAQKLLKLSEIRTLNGKVKTDTDAQINCRHALVQTSEQIKELRAAIYTLEILDPQNEVALWACMALKAELEADPSLDQVD